MRTWRPGVAADEPAFEEPWWGKKPSGITVTLAVANAGAVGELLEQAWRRHASRKLVAEYESE